MKQQPAKISIEAFDTLIENGLPWAAALDINIDHMLAGEVTMRLPYRSDSTRPGGSISGPHM
ncbi:MAG: hypothetical protein ACPGSM_09740, partial [Thiolinea sp.]